MIMRLSAIATASIILGACAAATVPVRRPIQVVGPIVDTHQSHRDKALNPRAGKLDPEINSRLDVIEGEVRALYPHDEQERPATAE